MPTAKYIYSTKRTGAKNKSVRNRNKTKCMYISKRAGSNFNFSFFFRIFFNSSTCKSRFMVGYKPVFFCVCASCFHIKLFIFFHTTKFFFCLWLVSPLNHRFFFCLCLQVGKHLKDSFISWSTKEKKVRIDFYYFIHHLFFWSMCTYLCVIIIFFQTEQIQIKGSKKQLKEKKTTNYKTRRTKRILILDELPRKKTGKRKSK